MPEGRLPWGGATRLDDEVLVGRAVTSKSHMKAGGRRQLFHRQPTRDPDGLSVLNRDACQPPEICKYIERTAHKCYGIITLRVGAIRSIELADLDVEPDAEPDPTNTCDHAVITGLPFHSGENADPALAEEIAIAIYETCRVGVWSPDPE